MRRTLPAGLAATGLALALAGCGGSSGDADGAIAYCHQFVEDRLRAPATADFPGFPDHQVYELTPTGWRVAGYVDAENGFGANVRTDWTCEISYEESSGTWTLESMTGV
ncbi:hypothetical protein ACI79D_14840 [Geodermatophilus sp. SYSU D00708]